MITEDKPIDFGTAIMHYNVPEEVAILGKEVKARFQPVELLVTESGRMIGIHSNPRTLGVVFYNE